jgi:hypothetical protein
VNVIEPNWLIIQGLAERGDAANELAKRLTKAMMLETGGGADALTVMFAAASMMFAAAEVSANKAGKPAGQGILLVREVVESLHYMCSNPPPSERKDGN